MKTLEKTFIEESEALLKEKRVRKIIQDKIERTKMPLDHKYIPEKTHADTFEAIIGAYMKTFKSIDHC